MDQSCLIKRQSEKQQKTSIKRDTSVDSSQYKRPTGTWSSVVRKMAYLPVRIANPGNSAADTMFWYSFRILPDRLRQIPLYPCGSSLGPSISFIFGARACHFAATPHSDVVRICECLFCAFITIWSQFHLHNYHHSQRALTESCQKLSQTLDLSFKRTLLRRLNFLCAGLAKIIRIKKIVTERVVDFIPIL